MNNLKNDRYEYIRSWNINPDFIKNLNSFEINKNKLKLIIYSCNPFVLYCKLSQEIDKEPTFILKKNDKYYLISNCILVGAATKDSEFVVLEFKIREYLISDICPDSTNNIGKVEKVILITEGLQYIFDNNELETLKNISNNDFLGLYFNGNNERVQGICINKSYKKLEDIFEIITQIWAFFIVNYKYELNIKNIYLTFEDSNKGQVVKYSKHNSIESFTIDFDSFTFFKKYFADFEKLRLNLKPWIYQLIAYEREYFFENQFRRLITGLECYVRERFRLEIKKLDEGYELIKFLGVNADFSLRHKINYIVSSKECEKFFTENYYTDSYDFSNKNDKNKFIDHCVNIRNKITHYSDDNGNIVIINDKKNIEILYILEILNKIFLWMKMGVDEKSVENLCNKYYSELNMIIKSRKF